MHRFEVEPVAGRWQPPAPATGCCQQRMISLRKYSLAICLAELLAIVLFIYLLMQAPPAAPSTRLAREPGNVTKLYRTYSAGANSSRFLVGLVSGCNQRKHDLPLGVRCDARWARRPLDCVLPREPVGAAVGGDTSAQSDEALPALVVVTSMAGERLAERRLGLARVDCGVENNSSRCRFATRASVKADKRGQRILGWGGALTDSSINNMLALTINTTTRLLDDYFEELAFNLVRITIGGSDFSARFYTNNDEPPRPGARTAVFALREEDILYKIPLLRLIQGRAEREPHRRRPIKLFASMWSPPVWMKSNQFYNGGQLLGATSDEPERNYDERYFDALAQLKANFVRAYQNQSVRFWGLTVMNEPLFALQPFLNFNTMVFPARDYANYVAKYLGPVLRDDPALRHLKLMAHDDNRRYLANFTAPMLRETRVRQFIDGVSVHGYVDEDYRQMDELYRTHNNRLNPNFFVLPTELCSGHLPFMEKPLVGNWHRGVHYALDIVRSLQHSAAGWVDWNMALDLEGGPGWLGGRLDAPVIVDKAADAYYKSPMFYVLGQFSRYIPPDSWRIETEMLNDKFDGHFEVVSFEVPREATRGGRFVTVVVNNNPYPVELQLKLPDRRIYAASCAANSVTTLLYCNYTTPAC